MKALQKLLPIGSLLYACITPSTPIPQAEQEKTVTTPPSTLPSTPTNFAFPAVEPTPDLATPSFPQRGYAGPAAPPAPAITFQNRIFAEGQAYVFEYATEQHILRYRYLPQSGSLHDLTVEAAGLPPFWISFYGGPIFAFDEGEIPIWDAESLIWSHSQPILTQDTLTIQWRAANSRQAIEYTYRFSIHGKTLRLEVDSSSEAISAFSLDRTEGTPAARILRIPYLSTFDLLYYGGYFISAYFDWTQSNASFYEAVSEEFSDHSFHFSQIAFYKPNTNRERHSLHEVIYLTVSDRLAEVLPVIPNPPSPHRQTLLGRTVIDLWSEGHFAESAALIQTLQERGVKDLIVIRHAWQRCGYDDCYPSVLPARSEWGGDAAMQTLSQVTRQAGYLFALHENYADLYPNSDFWSDQYLALDSEGNYVKAWFNETSGIQSYLLSPFRSTEVAQQFAPEIHHRYSTNAAFLDVHTAIPPWEKIDYNHRFAGNSHFNAVFQAYTDLLSLLRSAHQGPILGEGGAHFLYAGLVDGVEAEDQGDLGIGRDTPPIVDFALLRIHPLMVNHGMGYFPTYFGSQEQPKWGRYALADHYHYMANEIAFCHAGYVDTPELFESNEAWLAWVEREVRLVSPIHQRCALAKARQILYRVNDRLVGIEEALPAGQLWQVFVQYENGLQVYVNRHPQQAWQVALDFMPSWVDFSAIIDGKRQEYVGDSQATSFLLPPYGWLAVMP